MEKRRAFITMRSISSMTIFDWERHIEELHAALGRAVGEEKWDEICIYGPNTGGFSPPAMCIEAVMSAAEAASLLLHLSEAAPWLAVPVHVYFDTTEVVSGGQLPGSA